MAIKYQSGFIGSQRVSSDSEAAALIDGLNTFARGFDTFARAKGEKITDKTTQEAEIVQNPDTGIYEHDSAEWLSFKKMKSKAYGFLVPVVSWAESLIIK